jgi:hypothetical protein
MSTDLLPRLARIGALAALVAVACGFTYLYSPFTGLPIKWRSATIPLHIQLGSDTPLSDGTNFSTSVQAAAEMWNAQLGDTRFDVTIDPAGPAYDDNGRNELAFGDGIYGLQFGYGVLAATTVLYDDEDVNRRIEADTIFNTAYAWDSYRGDPRSGTLDIRRVALHELGHNLGLDHPDDEGQVVTAIMNSQAGSQETLSADDITGAQNLYGPPGTPANDAFANAIAITTAPDGTATVDGYNTNATRESYEPEHAGNPGGRSIWWKWTAPYTATVSVDTDGSYCDTLLAVYTGASISSLTLVAASDDIDPGIVQSSRVDLAATAGTTYYFAVDGFNAADGFGADSAAIRLHLGGERPSITTQPASVSTTTGGSASFSVVAGGAGPLTYQWYFGGSPIEGATSATLTLTDVQSAQAGSYTVTVSNAFGSVTSEAATLSVTSTPPPDDGGGSDGGGGAPGTWFLSALGVLALTRRLFGKTGLFGRMAIADAS